MKTIASNYELLLNVLQTQMALNFRSCFILAGLPTGQHVGIAFTQWYKNGIFVPHVALINVKI